jgi:hypothetical protein
MSTLSGLLSAEFLYEQPATGEVEYTFKHALTQEVAYNSVLIERRKVLHERIAMTMEDLFAAQIEDHLGELARHYARSCNARKSVDYALLAGRQAAQRSAYAEAIAYLNAGLEALSTLPEGLERERQELDLQIASGGVLAAAKGYASGDVERAYLRARKLCEQAGTSVQMFQVLDGLRWFYGWKGDLGSALQLDEEMLGLALFLQDPALEAISLVDRGIDRYVVGEFASAREDLERVLGMPARQRRRSFAARTQFGAEQPSGCETQGHRDSCAGISGQKRTVGGIGSSSSSDRRGRVFVAGVRCSAWSAVALGDRDSAARSTQPD